MSKGKAKRERRRARQQEPRRLRSGWWFGLCACCLSEEASVKFDEGPDLQLPPVAHGDVSVWGPLYAHQNGGDELFALTDRAEIMAWLDARGLEYELVSDEPQVRR